MEKLLTIFIIICILLTLVTAAYTLLKPDYSKGIDDKTNLTDFYIKELNNSNTINFNSGEQINLTMVLVNQEGSTVNYRILVKVNDTILKQDNITLQNNQKMEIPLDFIAGTPGERKMEFLLYKLPDKNQYKKLSLMLKIT
jgi:uncharacterized membrane protein